jgi:hypothetical protein
MSSSTVTAAIRSTETGTGAVQNSMAEQWATSETARQVATNEKAVPNANKIESADKN